jgi:hypothetical protein
MPTPKPGESREDYMRRCVPMVMDEGHDQGQAVVMCQAKLKEQAMAKGKRPAIIALSAPVTISAAEGEGASKGPAKFTSTFYTGGKLDIEGWDLPVVIDLAGLKPSKVLVANLDHDRTKRVGNFAVANDGKSLVANGTASAATAARDEVVDSARDGYVWQSSLEVNPEKVQEVKAGKTVEANGQTFDGPMYVTRVGTLKGLAFVSHGADDDTQVTIAASAASTKETVMKAEVKAWAESMGIDVENATTEQQEKIEANFTTSQLVTPPKKRVKLDEGIDAKQAETDRIDAITDIALNACDKRPYEIKAIKELAQQGIDGKWGVDKFRLELLEATTMAPGVGVFSSKRDGQLTNDVLEAALCQAGNLPDIEKQFDEKVLDAAHKRFRGRIGLKQLFLLCAQANGFNDGNMDVTLEVQRAAFRMTAPRQHIHAAGFSTIDISDIVSNVANKFVFRGWNAVDQTPLRIAKIQNVRDFKTATTVSLTDSVRYEQVAGDGEIKHGTLGELSYTNKADTYAKMLAITRQDIINDDTGALTDVPMKLGNGAMKLLNHIFWTEFLSGVSTSFFASGNSNINTGVADMTLAGLAATETIFLNQTNPDGTPLGMEAAIVLVPSALKATASALLDPQSVIVSGASAGMSNINVFRGRFRLESSPYISNSTYTGNTSTAWWLLADPNVLPVIAIAALNGNVMPTVETADAEFNVLGVQMRGYSDVGVNFQEYRGGVHADGGSS